MVNGLSLYIKLVNTSLQTNLKHEIISNRLTKPNLDSSNMKFLNP